MFPSSDSNHNSNIKLNLVQFHTKRNTKPVSPDVGCVVKFLKMIAISKFTSFH